MERKAWSSSRHSGSWAISAAMAVSSSPIWRATRDQQFIEGNQHGGIADQAGLVALRGADLGELAQARD